MRIDFLPHPLFSALHFHLQLIWFDWAQQAASVRVRSTVRQREVLRLRFSSSLPVFKVRCEWVFPPLPALSNWLLWSCLARVTPATCRRPKNRLPAPRVVYAVTQKHRSTQYQRQKLLGPKLWTAVWQLFDAMLPDFTANFLLKSWTINNILKMKRLSINSIHH